jgi:hypothetical protein
MVTSLLLEVLVHLPRASLVLDIRQAEIAEHGRMSQLVRDPYTLS